MDSMIMRRFCAEWKLVEDWVIRGAGGVTVQVGQCVGGGERGRCGERLESVAGASLSQSIHLPTTWMHVNGTTQPSFR